MEVSCYCMDLYCDHENDQHRWKEFPQTYTGVSRSQCVREARTEGWVFHRDGKVTCPKCNKQRKVS